MIHTSLGIAGLYMAYWLYSTPANELLLEVNPLFPLLRPFVAFLMGVMGLVIFLIGALALLSD